MALLLRAETRTPLTTKGKRTREVDATCVHKSNLPGKQGRRGALTWQQERAGIALPKAGSRTPTD